MKIIQTKEEVIDFTRRRDDADAGCWSCPACGREIDHMPQPRIDKVASTFFNEFVLVDRFGCIACGCVWEGDPYVKEGSRYNKRDDGLDYAFNS